MWQETHTHARDTPIHQTACFCSVLGKQNCVEKSALQTEKPRDSRLWAVKPWKCEAAGTSHRATAVEPDGMFPSLLLMEGKGSLLRQVCATPKWDLQEHRNTKAQRVCGSFFKKSLSHRNQLPARKRALIHHTLFGLFSLFYF